MILFLISYLNKNHIFFLYLGLFIIFFVSSTRFDTGYDFYNYHIFYTYTETLNDSLEPLFKFSIYFLNLFSSDSQLMFFIYSLITLFITYFTITKMSEYPKTAFLIFLLIPGLYLNSFSVIRHSIALSFFFLATYYLIYEKKTIKFFFYSFIAIGFHYTALIPILILYFSQKILIKNYSIIIYIILIIFSNIFSEINIPEFLIASSFGKFSVYLDYKIEISIIKQLVLNLFFLLLVLLKNKYVNSEQNSLILNLLFIGILLINIFSNYQFVTRITYYFLIFQVIIVPNIVYSFKKSINKTIILFLFISYYAIILFYSINLSFNIEEETKMKYKNYFFENSYSKE